MQAYKNALNTIKSVNHPSPSPPPLSRQDSLTSSAPQRPISPLDTSTTPAVSAPARPISASNSLSGTSTTSFLPSQPQSQSNASRTQPPSRHYVIHVSAFFSTLISAPTRHASSFLLHAATLVLSAFAPFFDKLLPHLLAQALSPAFLLKIVKSGKRTLFPNGWPAPPPIDPTPEEQAEMRMRLIAWGTGRVRSGWGRFCPAPFILNAKLLSL